MTEFRLPAAIHHNWLLQRIWQEYFLAEAVEFCNFRRKTADSTAGAGKTQRL
jgi:hypothetical protein